MYTFRPSVKIIFRGERIIRTMKANGKNCICLRGALLAMALILAATLFLPKVPAAAQPYEELYVKINVGADSYYYDSSHIAPVRPFEEIFEEHVIRDARGRIISGRQAGPAKFELLEIDAILEEIQSHYFVPAIPASVQFTPDGKEMFTLTEDVPGLRIDTERLKREITASLAEGRSYGVTVQPEPYRAELNADKVRASFALRSQFSTAYQNSTQARKHNIRLSLSNFHGMVIAPNASVSFNATTGPRTKERGYQSAKIIVNGKFTEGEGGGVCQSSTTLYNALLLADVKVDERHNHTLAVGYVPPAFDAMVNTYTSDLKFTNDTGNYLYLRVKCDQNTVTVMVYGEKLPYTVKRRSEVIKRTDPPPEEIISSAEYANLVKYKDETLILTPSKGGLIAEGYLDYYRGGKRTSSKRLHRDTYREMRGIAVRGTEERPRESVPAPSEEIS